MTYHEKCKKRQTYQPTMAKLEVTFIDKVEEYDYTIMVKALSRIPQSFLVNDEEFFFRNPSMIFIRWQQLITDDGMEYIVAPLKLLSNRNLSEEDLLKHDGVKLERHKLPYGYYNPSSNTITLCLGEIRRLAQSAVDFFEDLTLDEAYESLIKLVFLHELCHATFDTTNGLRGNERLSEGLANLIPSMICSPREIALLGYKSMRQAKKYNYYFLLRRFKQLDQLIKAAYDYDYSASNSLFYDGVVEPASRIDFDGGPTYLSTGDAMGIYFGFANENTTFFVGGTLDPICNISGSIVTSNLKAIDGYLDPMKCIVVVNEVGLMPFYDVLKPKNMSWLIKIPKTVVDIKQEAENRNFDYEGFIKKYKLWKKISRTSEESNP